MALVNFFAAMASILSLFISLVPAAVEKKFGDLFPALAFLAIAFLVCVVIPNDWRHYGVVEIGVALAFGVWVGLHTLEYMWTLKKSLLESTRLDAYPMPLHVLLYTPCLAVVLISGYWHWKSSRRVEEAPQRPVDIPRPRLVTLRLLEANRGSFVYRLAGFAFWMQTGYVFVHGAYMSYAVLEATRPYVGGVFGRFVA